MPQLVRWYYYSTKNFFKFDFYFYSFYSTFIWVNFFKEGFLFDFVQKYVFDVFVLNWIILGSLQLNFSYINYYQSKLFYSNFILRSLSFISGTGSFSLNNFFAILFLFFYAYAGFFLCVVISLNLVL